MRTRAKRSMTALILMSALAGVVGLVSSRAGAQPWPGPDPNAPRPNQPGIPVPGPGFADGQRGCGPNATPPVKTLAGCLRCCDERMRDRRPSDLYECIRYCGGVMWVPATAPWWTWPF